MFAAFEPHIGAVPVFLEAGFDHVFVPEGGDVFEGAVVAIGFIEGEKVEGAHVGLVVVEGVFHGGEFADQGGIFGDVDAAEHGVSGHHGHDGEDAKGEAGIEAEEKALLRKDVRVIGS